jgi:nitroimidazol reductase NimA-like FMN-containing flavoprotein (pyridoxamine 5'-phosphate oxidase superfamily)
MSVIGEGYAHFIEDSKKRIEALDIIMSKYSNNEAMTSFRYSETALNKVALIKIEIKLLSGKISGYK